VRYLEAYLDAAGDLHIDGQEPQYTSTACSPAEVERRTLPATLAA
jgi:hypothetical protein